MHNIQIKGVDSTLSQAVLEDIQHLKQHLDNTLASSDLTLIRNLVKETELLLEQAKDHSKTYQERYCVFSQLTESWFNAWKHYKDTPEAINFLRSIDHLTNYSIAYSQLLLSLAHINEGRIGEYKTDLERIVSGFLLLSETVDVFIEYFSNSELNQIHKGSKNAVSHFNRNVTEYFENGLELSNLITQLRAYSSLIILKIEEHTKSAESILEVEAAQSGNKVEIDLPSRPWWEKIAGTFANQSAYDEAMKLGQEYRASLRPSPQESSDV